MSRHVHANALALITKAPADAIVAIVILTPIEEGTNVEVFCDHKDAVATALGLGLQSVMNIQKGDETAVGTVLSVIDKAQKGFPADDVVQAG